MDARPAVAEKRVGPERGAEVRGDVRADREERHVAEVEQPGEADDDVQPERHDHVGRRQDHVVQRDAARAEEQRQDRGGAERGDGERTRERAHVARAAGAGSTRGSSSGCRRSTSRTTPPSGSSSGRRTRTRTGGSPSCAASRRSAAPRGGCRAASPRRRRRRAAAGSSAVRPSSSTATLSGAAAAAARMTSSAAASGGSPGWRRAAPGSPRAARAGAPRRRPRPGRPARRSPFSRSHAAAFAAVPIRSQSRGKSWLWELTKRCSSSSRPGAFGRPPGSSCSPIRRLSRSST